MLCVLSGGTTALKRKLGGRIIALINKPFGAVLTGFAYDSVQSFEIKGDDWMKKLAFLILLCCFIMTLTACGDGDHSSSEQRHGSAGMKMESDVFTGENTSPKFDGSDMNVAVGQPDQQDTVSEEIETPAGENTSPVPESSQPAGGLVVEESQQPEQAEEERMDQTTFYVAVGGATFSATFAENIGAQALRELLADGPVTISMSDYGGFEKVGSLSQSLPTSNSQTTTQAGDIVLYQGTQIVMFYGSNSWSYTRLGRVDDLTGWADALRGETVSVTFSLADEKEK